MDRSNRRTARSCPSAFANRHRRSLFLILRYLLALTLLMLSLPPTFKVAAANVVGNGKPASCTEAALDQAFVAGGEITFNCGPDPVTIVVTSMKVATNVTRIDGGNKITLSGGNTTCVLSVPDYSTLVLTNITISNSQMPPLRICSGVTNAGDLTVIHATFRDNIIAGIENRRKLTVSDSYFFNNFGSGIYNSNGSDSVNAIVKSSLFYSNTSSTGAAINNMAQKGTSMQISASWFVNNVVTGGPINTPNIGGAINNGEGSITIDNSAFTNNFSSYYGGAIGSTGAVSIVNSTFDGNLAGAGGAIYSWGHGTVDIVNSTLTDNEAGAFGGAIYTGNRSIPGTVTLRNSILGNNQPDSCAGQGIIHSYGMNINSGSGQPCFFGFADFENTDPRLGPLQDNGGYTPTRAPNTGSPALDRIVPAACPPTDQRGAPRPLGPACDIGAYELGGVTPSISGLDPAMVAAASGPFVMTIQGSKFIAGVKVLWNGVEHSTDFISSTQLQVTIPAASIPAPGIVNVQVKNPGPGDGTSNTLVFTIGNPHPSITGLSPSMLMAGGGDFLLTVAGSNFIHGASHIVWNGVPLATSFTNDSTLQATVPDSYRASPGTANITVATDGPGGGTSNTLVFTVSNPIPVISALSPTTVPGGSSGFTLTVTGNSFIRGASAIRWNNLMLSTVFVSGTTLQAHIPASYLLATGTMNISVYTAAPGGGTSASIPLKVVQPSPITGTIDSAGGSISSPDGKIQIGLPPSAVTQTVLITYTQLLKPNHALEQGRGSLRSFLLEASYTNGQPVAQFLHPLTLIIDYDPLDLAAQGVLESSLNLFAWDGSAWSDLLPCTGCSLNTGSKRITGMTDRPAEFVLAGDQWLLALSLAQRNATDAGW